MDIRERIDELLRAELVTIGIDIDDARTGQMWAYDSERLSKRILNLPVSEEGECPLCYGIGKNPFGGGYGCVSCNKTGRLSPKTLKHLIEEAE